MAWARSLRVAVSADVPRQPVIGCALSQSGVLLRGYNIHGWGRRRSCCLRWDREHTFVVLTAVHVPAKVINWWAGLYVVLAT